MKIAVVGGGFTGLTTAYCLFKRGYKPVLFSDPAEPGLIQTHRTESGLIETAANGMLCNQAIEQIALDIGVELLPTKKTARRRYLYRNRPERWPLSFTESMGFLTRLIRNLLQKKAAPLPLESLKTWGDRVLGQAFTEKLLRTAVLGIYASSINELSASLVVGRFFRKKSDLQKSLSRKSKLTGTVSTRGGMGAWLSALENYLEKNGIELKPQRFLISDMDSFDAVFICTKPEQASQLVLDGEQKALLNQIELVPIVTTHCFFKESKESFKGFGCLFHPEAQSRSLGVLFSSDIFSDRVAEGLRSETYIMGGPGSDVVNATDSQILEWVLQDRARISDLNQQDIQSYKITRWPKAFPIYNLNLEKILKKLPIRKDKVWLNGNYLGHLGLAQIVVQTAVMVERFHEKARHPADSARNT